jgi:2-C-methyl-D-erythritol 4-phosphate cytidylyltransferase/2-C-methyl-D-erythritol 2,4-cyclodiphosphate synthase
MGGEPKQIRHLEGRPMMCWAARPLLQGLSGPLIVVLPESALEEGAALLAEHFPEASARVRVTAGGARRSDSVRAGLEAAGDGPSTVLVHDAARPFASRGLVERVATRAAAGRAVVPALPVRDTLKEIDGERVVATRDRSRYVAAQTPQGFPRALLLDAFAAAGDDEATDCAALCERFGAPVHWVLGEPLNRKLTDADDWLWAERVIESGWVRWEGEP